MKIRISLLFTAKNILLVLCALLVNFNSMGQCVTTFPYNESFENSNGNWTTGGTNNDWAWGVPTKININSAAAGSKCWISGNLSGNAYNGGEKSWVESPCFDFTSLVNPIIKFSIYWDTERQYDGGNLQFSINNGTTWSNVGSSNDPVDCYNKNWFNSTSITNLGGVASPTNGWSGNLQNSTGGCLGGNGSGQWVEAAHCLGFLAGKSSVKFRFTFGSGTTCNNFDGIAFDQVFIGEIQEPVYDFLFTCTGGNAVTFNATSTDCPSQYSWNFDDPNSSSNTLSGINVNHDFSAAGDYSVTLTINYPCIGIRTISKHIKIPDLVVSTTDVTCVNDSNGTAMATVSLVSNPILKWLPMGTSGQSIDHLPPGQYTVTIIGASDVCEKTVPFTIGLGPNANPNVNIGGLIKICPGDAVKLNPGNFTKYWWSTGDTTAFIVVADSGTYSVIVQNSAGCNATDSVKIIVGCGYDVWFPSAFTPDEDGVNDIFKGYGYDVSEYHLIVFNRMGQVVFESYDINKGWDGNEDGSSSPIGVYGYTASYKLSGSDSIRKRNIFTLLR
ncbi:MAG: gliding motility-associated C-terminal domain-containing protein [Bacteroidota bacterium]